MKPMNIDRNVIEKCDRNRLFELVFVYGLTAPQAVVVHLCTEKGWRLRDVAELVQASPMAVSDCRAKGRSKLV